MRIARRLLLVVIVAVCATARAEGDPEAARFEAAIAMEGRGQLAEAARALEAFSEASPGHALAPDALREAATLYEDHLFQPASALRCWRTLAERHPQHASAERARTRVAALSGQLSTTSAADLGELERLIASGGAAPDAAARAQVTRFVEAHPEPRLVARAAHWLARAADLAGDEAEALRRYDEAMRTEGPYAPRAARDKAEMLLRHRRYQPAKHAYVALSRYTDPVSKLAYAAGMRELARQERLRRWAVYAWITIALFFAAHLWLGRGGFRPVPVEVRFLAPVAVLFLIAGATEHRSIGIAVACIATGGVLVSWAAGSARQAMRARRGQAPPIALRLLLGLFAAAAVLSIAYLAVRENELVDLVAETLKMGPER